MVSPDPHDYPKIHPNYLSTDTDRRAAIDGMKLSRKFAATNALSELISEEWLPGPDVQTDEQYLAAARKIAQTIYHPVGTCRMGTDDHAVVDPRLRVRGVEGLRVADASIMPTITSGNTNAPAIMIGEKAAEMILEDSRA